MDDSTTTTGTGSADSADPAEPSVGSATDSVELFAAEAVFAENCAAAARCRGVHALFHHHESQLELRLAAMGPGEPDWSRLDPFDHASQGLVAATGMTYSRAGDVVTLAVDVHEWAPAVLEAMESGLMCERIAMLLCGRMRDVDPELRHQVQAEVVADYLERIKNGERPSRRATSRRADGVIETIDPEGAAARRREAAFSRSVRFRREDRGMCTMTARLTAAAGAVLAERIDAFAGRVAPGDRRNLEQRRADALVAMATGEQIVVDPDAEERERATSRRTEARRAEARRAEGDRAEGDRAEGDRTECDGAGAGPDGRADDAAAGRADEHPAPGPAPAPRPAPAPVNVSPMLRPRVTVIATGVGSPQLEFARTGEAALDTLTRLLEESQGATFELVDTREGTHDDVASAIKYRIPPDLARRVQMRDGTCRHPGCAVPAEACDIDHIVPFNHSDPGSGGLTIESNLMCLCRRHHRYKTFSDTGYEYFDGGRIRISFGRHVLTTSPTGPLARARGFVTPTTEKRRPAAGARGKLWETAGGGSGAGVGPGSPGEVDDDEPPPF